MDLLNQLAQFYSQNKEALQLLGAVIVYCVVHRQTVLSYVRKQAGTLMLSAEKGSENLLLTSGAQKMDWVVQQAYQKMPAAVRVVVSMDQFRKIAQDIYNDAASVVVQNKKPDAQVGTSTPITVNVAAGSDPQQVAQAVQDATKAASPSNVQN